MRRGRLFFLSRPGNQRFDTFCNLFQSLRAGLIFLIPGKSETLRIGGSAQVVRDQELLESMAARGKAPSADGRRRARCTVGGGV